MNLAEKHSDRSADSGRTGNREFLDLYMACDDLVDRILALPHSYRFIDMSGDKWNVSK